MIFNLILFSCLLLKMELHPNSFVETGSCAGPRYIRTQPNRESSGVLLDSVTDKYVAEFDLPYRNLIRYTKEIENEWPKLDSHQKEIIKNSLSMFVYESKMGNDDSTQPSIEAFTDDIIIEPVPEPINTNDVTNRNYDVTNRNYDVAKYLSENPHQVPNLLDYLAMNDKTSSSVSSWCYQNSYYRSGWSFWTLFFFILLMALLIGVGTGYNSK